MADKSAGVAGAHQSLWLLREATRSRRQSIVHLPSSGHLIPAVARFFGSLFLIVLAVGTVRWSGLLDYIDVRIEQAAYSVRGARASGHHAVLVAIDEATEERWGPAPWPESRLEQLEQRTGARAIVFVGAPRRLFSAPQSRPTGTDLELSRFESPWIRQVGVGPRSGELAATLAAMAPSSCVSDERLTIDYLGGRDRLPTISAHEFAAGALPPEALAEKVVLVGVTSRRLASRAPTPVGWLSEPEIATHAVATAADGACAPPLSLAVRLGLVGLVAALGLWIGARRSATFGALAIAGVLLMVSGLYYASFVNHWWSLSSTDPALAVILGFTVARAHERRQARRALRTLARGLAAAPAEGVSRTAKRPLGASLAAAIEVHLDDVHSSLLGTFAGPSSRMELAPICGASLEDVLYSGYAPGNDPFRTAASGGQMLWTRQLMRDPELRTLVVPIVGAQGVVALWFINYTAEPFVSPLQRPLVDRIARGIADALGGHDGGPSASVAAPMLLQDVAAVGAGLKGRLEETHRLADVAGRLPAAIFVASEWAEVSWMNREARQLCAAAQLPADATLDTMLGRIMSISASQVRAALRRVVTVGLESRLTGFVQHHSGHKSYYQISIARSDAAGDEKQPSVVVMALSSSRVGGHDGEGFADDTFDLRESVMAALGDARRRNDGPEARPVALDLADPLPPARGEFSLFRDAISFIITELVAPAGRETALRIRVRCESDRICIALFDPELGMPRIALEALLFEEAATDSGNLARAVQLLETQGVTVEARDREADGEAGACIHLSVPRPSGTEGK